MVWTETGYMDKTNDKNQGYNKTRIIKSYNWMNIKKKNSLKLH